MAAVAVQKTSKPHYSKEADGTYRITRGTNGQDRRVIRYRVFPGTQKLDNFSELAKEYCFLSKIAQEPCIQALPEDDKRRSFDKLINNIVLEITIRNGGMKILGPLLRFTHSNNYTFKSCMAIHTTLFKENKGNELDFKPRIEIRNYEIMLCKEDVPKLAAAAPGDTVGVSVLLRWCAGKKSSCLNIDVETFKALQEIDMDLDIREAEMATFEQNDSLYSSLIQDLTERMQENQTLCTNRLKSSTFVTIDQEGFGEEDELPKAGGKRKRIR